MASRGFILLHRQIQDHWIWTANTPFDDRSAWIDLLLLANHEDKKIPYNKGFRMVKRGQHLTSQAKLAERWHWSRDRVKRFLQRLKKDSMIEYDSTTNNTTITLVNYGRYQDTRPTNKATDKATNKAPYKATHKAQTNNDRNNDRNNEEIKEQAPPSPGEGYVWNDYVGRWVAPPKDGGKWQ